MKLGLNALIDARRKILYSIDQHLAEPRCEHTLYEIMSFEENKEKEGWSDFHTNPTTTSLTGSSAAITTTKTKHSDLGDGLS